MRVLLSEEVKVASSVSDVSASVMPWVPADYLFCATAWEILGLRSGHGRRQGTREPCKAHASWGQPAGREGRFLHLDSQRKVERADSACVVRGQINHYPIEDVEPFGVMVLLLCDERAGGHEPEGFGEASELVLAMDLPLTERPAWEVVQAGLHFFVAQLGDLHAPIRRMARAAKDEAMSRELERMSFQRPRAPVLGGPRRHSRRLSEAAGAWVCIVHSPPQRRAWARPGGATSRWGINVTGKEDETMDLLWIVAVVFFVLWVLGFTAFHVTSGFVHILLILAVVAVVFRLVTGRRTA
jgi:hypothetical protein